MLPLPFIGDVVKKLKIRIYDDWVDRLNYYVTPVLLFFFALVTSTKFIFGNPIHCRTPHNFKGNWDVYVDSYCFIENTFYSPMGEEIPDESSQQTLAYYQWVPLLLAFQALLFLIPRILWKVYHSQTGLSLRTIMKKADDITGNMRKDDRIKELEMLTNYVRNYTDIQEKTKNVSPRRFCFIRIEKRRGNFVSVLYLTLKLVSFVNIALQLYFVGRFLGSDDYFWGFRMVNDLMNGREWRKSGNFPRVTFCMIPTLPSEGGDELNVQKTTVTCVLPMNLVNEKIFLFIWFWFIAVAILTLVNLAQWSWFLFNKKYQNWLVTTYLKLAFPNLDKTWVKICEKETCRQDLRNTVKLFVQSVLRRDGLLLMRFIDDNSGDFVVINIIGQLFLEHTEHTGKGPLRLGCNLANVSDEERGIRSPRSTTTSSSQESGIVSGGQSQQADQATEVQETERATETQSLTNQTTNPNEASRQETGAAMTTASQSDTLQYRRLSNRTSRPQGAGSMA